MNNKFNFSTVENFDNHISNSIYGYNLLYNLILNLIDFFVDENDIVIDIGCTTGKLLKNIKEKYKTKCIGYDVTDKQFINDLDLRIQDITEKDFLFPQSNLFLSIFTLQFISLEKREIVLKKIYNSLSKNGIFIFCEKEIIESGFFQDVFTFANYDYKKSNFSSDEILLKEKQLRAIMKCNTYKQNIDLLKKTGFKEITIFFNSLNFKGYICKK